MVTHMNKDWEQIIRNAFIIDDANVKYYGEKGIRLYTVFDRYGHAIIDALLTEQLADGRPAPMQVWKSLGIRCTVYRRNDPCRKCGAHRTMYRTTDLLAEAIDAMAMRERALNKLESDVRNSSEQRRRI